VKVFAQRTEKELAASIADGLIVIMLPTEIVTRIQAQAEREKISWMEVLSIAIDRYCADSREAKG
jgi:hypothetical protein